MKIKSHLKIAVMSLYTENIANYGKTTSEIHEKYCSHNNYTYIKYTESLDEARHPSWSKILAVKKSVDDYDWILWLDADTLINNHNTRIEDLIDESYNIIMCGDSLFPLNCGVMLFKCSNETTSILEEVYGMTRFIDNGFWEQAAMLEYYRHHSESFKIVPQQVLNSYIDHANQDTFVMHFPGVYRCYMSEVLEAYMSGNFSAGKLRHKHFTKKLKENISNNKPWYSGLEGKWWWGMNKEQFLEKVSDENFEIN